MRVLVTGGCGLIGFNAAKYYHGQGHDVEVMDNLERSSLLGHEVSSERARFNLNELRKMEIPVHLNDVSDNASWRNLDGHDYVLHFAGQCGVPTSILNPRRDMEVNYIGTFNTLEYCRRSGAALAFASTNKIYPIHDAFKKRGKYWGFNDPVHNVHGVNEDAIFVGSRTPYGASKYSADVLCQEYAHTFGVRTGVFRMSCIYGPNQFGFEEQGWAVWFIIATLKGLPITIYGDGDQVRDMLYVEDCVKAYDAFLKSDLKHGVWNLGGGPGNVLSLNNLLNYLHVVTGKRSPLKFDGWRPSDQKCYISDIRKVTHDLDWTPTVSPEEGILKSLEWTKKNLEVF